MGFYPPDSLVHEAQRRGIRVAPPDANRSRRPLPRRNAARKRVRGGLVVRVGLGYVKGVREGGDGGAGRRARARRALPRDRRPRLALGRRPRRASNGWPGRGRWTASRPASARSEPPRGALAGRGRRRRPRGAASGTQLALPLEPPRAAASWSRWASWGRLIADYRSTGMTLDEHPMELMRAGLDPELAAQHRPGPGRRRREVEVAGMVVARQRPETAKGIVFMLLEDERGTVNLIVPPPVYERHRAWSAPRPCSAPAAASSAAKATINVLVSAIGAAASGRRPPERRETPRPSAADASAPSPSCAPSPPPATASAAAALSAVAAASRRAMPSMPGRSGLRAAGRSHRRELHAHCYRMLGSLHDAEDALQEAMLRAWRGLERFEGRSSLRAWLYRIATNTCLDAIARRPSGCSRSSTASTADRHDGPASRVVESVWIEPYPDETLERRGRLRLARGAATSSARRRAGLRRRAAAPAAATSARR